MPTTLDLTLGAIEMGAMISAIMYGMVTVQCYMYAMANKTDRTWLKALVGLVWVLETLHIISMMAYVYTVTVHHFGDESALFTVKWFVVINITFSSLVGSPVQAYFTWRAWVVSAKAWYAIPPWLIEFVRFVIVMVNCFYLAKSKTMNDFKAGHGYLVTTTLAICVFVDMWNSAILCYHLRTQRTAFERTMKYINSIMIWSVETSLVVCVLAIFSIVLWLALPNSTLWLCILMIHAKVYSNSMLISLNARIIRKAAAARPSSLARTWELARIRPAPGTSSTQPDSAAIMTPPDSHTQFAILNYDSKFAAPTSPTYLTPSFGTLSYGDPTHGAV